MSAVGAGAVLLSTMFSLTNGNQVTVPQSDMNHCRQQIERMVSHIQQDPDAELQVISKSADATFVRFQYGLSLGRAKYQWQRIECLEQ